MDIVIQDTTTVQERAERRVTMLPVEQIRRRVRARKIPELAALLYCSDVGDDRASLEAASPETRARYESCAVEYLLGSARDVRTDAREIRHGFQFTKKEIQAADRLQSATADPFGGGQ